MTAEIWICLFWLSMALVSLLLGLMVFWLGEWHAHQHPRVPIPPQPTCCPWCGGPLHSVLVWSSVCRVCNRGQVGPFPEKEKQAPPFVSHVDVAARHASDSPAGFPWQHL